MDSKQRAAQLSPSVQLAARHFQAGRLVDAEQACEAAIRADPGDAHALHLYGLVSYRLGKPDLAVDALEQAVGLDPRNPALVNNLGETYRALKRADEAEACYLKALAIDPEYADARANLALLMRDLGRVEHSPQNYVNLGSAFEAGGRVVEAEQCFRQALAMGGVAADAHHGLGRALEALGRLEDAARSLRDAVALDPDLAEAHHSLGNVLLRLGRPGEAEQSYGRALLIKPDLDVAKFGCAVARLFQGNYSSGLPLYESRFAGADPRHTALVRPLLAQLESAARCRRDEDLRGSTLLVWTEQGMGDSLMAMRYLPRLKDRGVRRLIVYCERDLLRLMRAAAGVDDAVSKDHPLPTGAFDFHCPIMSLPWLFDTRLETIPGNVPYIRVPDEIKRADRFAAIEPLRVGLCWAGGRLFQSDPLRTRSIPTPRLAPLLAVPGASFVSLQKGDEARQLADTGGKILDWMEDCGDFLDTAALMEHLDLVISVDTAVAHLAGALGKPVWLLNRFESEWRWMLRRDDSPWYPTMRIFRQTRAGEWDSVIAEVAAALRTLGASRRGAGNSRMRRLFFPSSA